VRKHPRSVTVTKVRREYWSVLAAIMGGGLLGRWVSTLRGPRGTVVDLRAQGAEGLARVEKRDGEAYRKKALRPISDITGLVLHQMSFDYASRGNDPLRYDGVRAHFIVLADGGLYMLHDPAVYLFSSSALNSKTVAVEVAGNFQRKAGDWYRPEKFGKNSGPTPAQIESVRYLVSWLRDYLRQHGSDLEGIYTHGQASKAKRGCPGPQIWCDVVPWARKRYKIPDVSGETYGTGTPVPDYYKEWDDSGKFV